MRKLTNEELGRATLDTISAIEKMPVVVVLDNVRSTQNVGSVFRTSDAFGVKHVALCGITATPPNRDIHKTALGAEQSVEWSYYASTEECVCALRDKGYAIYAVEQVEGSISLEEFEFERDKPCALIFGNEVMGVDQSIVDMCDGAIEIPQVGTKHSLNVSVSAGVVLWHFFASTICEIKSKP